MNPTAVAGKPSRFELFCIGEKVKQARTFEGNLRFLCLKFEFQRQEEEVGEEGH